MTDPRMNTAAAEIEAATAQVSAHLQAKGGQVHSAFFGKALAMLLIEVFLAALSDEAKKQAAQLGVDVVRWIVGRIRAFFKTEPQEPSDMRIMPHIPAGGDVVEVERELSQALGSFMPAGDAAELARAVRISVERHLL